jgi:hypothetical protein
MSFRAVSPEFITNICTGASGGRHCMIARAGDTSSQPITTTCVRGKVTDESTI